MARLRFVTMRSHPLGDIRVGIVGCGRAATSLHAPALRRVDRARVVALSDTDSERLQRLGARCAGAAEYSDYRELLADPRVDLVAVCVPVTQHAEVAAAALHAAKHVFIEKPLALTLADAIAWSRPLGKRRSTACAQWSDSICGPTGWFAMRGDSPLRAPGPHRTAPDPLDGGLERRRPAALAWGAQSGRGSHLGDRRPSGGPVAFPVGE